MAGDDLRIFRAERGLAAIQALAEIIYDAGTLSARSEAIEARCVELEAQIAVLANALRAATREVERLRAASPSTPPGPGEAAPDDAG